MQQTTQPTISTASPTWTIRKRTLGLTLVACAIVAALGIIALNLIRASTHSGIGPAQRLAFVGCAALAILGITIARFGIDPSMVSDSVDAPLTATDSSRVLIWVRRLVIGAAVLLLTFHLIVYVVYAISLAQFPFDYDQGEGFELNDTVLLSQGQSPYRVNEVYPFYASNYPPLYHVILVPFVWLFGPQYWYGRLAGFLATLITAAVISYAVYRASSQRTIALLSGLAFLASNYIYHIGPLFRQHILMVMFETLAVVIIAGIDFRGDMRRQRRLLLIGLIFLLAAGYTKQLAIATVAAVFLYLFLNVPRRAIAWGVIFAAVAGGIFVIINVATGGQWWLNTITANVNEYILSQFRGLLSQFISLHGALLLLAVLYIIYELYFDRLSLYSIWFVAAAVDGVLAGKWGAGDSYFSTMIAAMCILAGLFTARCLNRNWRLPVALSRLSEQFSLWPKSSVIGIAACGLFVLYGLAVVKMPLDGPIFGPLARALNLQSNTKFANFYDAAGWTMGYATIGQIPTAQDVANGWKIVAAVKGDPRPILSEEAAFSFHTGKPIVSNPTQLRNLYLNGHYDPSALVKLIDDQAFGAVIFRAGFYPEPVLAAVKRSYTGQQQIDMNGYQYTILIPNSTP
ncbi:MAG: glycosyltransferase family 39 protein [Chloroflexota bacterium]